MRVEVTEPAIADVIEIRGWLRSRSPKRETRFVSDFQRALRQLHDHPLSGVTYLGGTRMLLIDRGDYMVIHMASDDTVMILRIIHTSRKPGFWLERD